MAKISPRVGKVAGNGFRGGPFEGAHQFIIAGRPATLQPSADGHARADPRSVVKDVDCDFGTVTTNSPAGCRGGNARTHGGTTAKSHWQSDQTAPA